MNYFDSKFIIISLLVFIKFHGSRAGTSKRFGPEKQSEPIETAVRESDLPLYQHCVITLGYSPEMSGLDIYMDIFVDVYNRLGNHKLFEERIQVSVEKCKIHPSNLLLEESENTNSKNEVVQDATTKELITEYVMVPSTLAEGDAESEEDPETRRISDELQTRQKQRTQEECYPALLFCDILVNVYDYVNLKNTEQHCGNRQTCLTALHQNGYKFKHGLNNYAYMIRNNKLISEGPVNTIGKNEANAEKDLELKKYQEYLIQEITKHKSGFDDVPMWCGIMECCYKLLKGGFTDRYDGSKNRSIAVDVYKKDCNKFDEGVPKQYCMYLTQESVATDGVLGRYKWCKNTLHGSDLK